jgi:hypothetical protein
MYGHTACCCAIFFAVLLIITWQDVSDAAWWARVTQSKCQLVTASGEPAAESGLHSAAAAEAHWPRNAIVPPQHNNSWVLTSPSLDGSVQCSGHDNCHLLPFNLLCLPAGSVQQLTLDGLLGCAVGRC